MKMFTFTDWTTVILTSKIQQNEPNWQFLPLTACFSCHTHGRTCSDDSTSFPYSPQRGALLDQGKTGGRAHSMLGNTASAKRYSQKTLWFKNVLTCMIFCYMWLMSINLRWREWQSNRTTVSINTEQDVLHIYLVLPFTGTKEADIGWHQRCRGQYT